MKKPWLFLLFAAIALAVGGGLFWVRQHAIDRTEDAQTWTETPCTVLTSGWKKSDDIHYLDITYSYQWRNEQYTSDQLHLMVGEAGDNDSWYRKMERDYPAGTETTCFVNPKDPSDAVLDRTHALDGLRALALLSTIMLSIGALFTVLFANALHGSFNKKTSPARKTSPIARVESEPDRSPILSDDRKSPSFAESFVFVFSYPKGNFIAWAFFLGFAFVSGIILDGRGLVKGWIPGGHRGSAPAVVNFVEQMEGSELGDSTYRYFFDYTVAGQAYESTSHTRGQKFSEGDTATAEYDATDPARAWLVGTRVRETPAWVICLFGFVPALMAPILMMAPFRNLTLLGLFKRGKATTARQVGRDPLLYEINVDGCAFKVPPTLDSEAADSTPTVLYDPGKPSRNMIVDGLPKYMYADDRGALLADLPHILVMPIGVALTIAMF